MILAAFLLLSGYCRLTAKDVKDVAIITDRPDKEKGPTEVSFFIFVLDIKSIDGADQSFTANVFMEIQWKDTRLVQPGDLTRTIPLDDAWNPGVIVANRVGFLPTSLPEVLKVTPDGTVTYSQRYVGQMSQPLNLSKFPFDSHRFGIKFVSTTNTPKEVRFIPMPGKEDKQATGGDMTADISVPDWQIDRFGVKGHPYNPIEEVDVAGFAFEFSAKRYRWYYVWQIIIPLTFIVMMSWGCFWIDPIHPGAQVTVATSSMLTLIAYRFTLGNLIPRLPYMTRMDYFTLLCTTLVFLTFVEVTITTVLSYRKKHVPGRMMDKFSRVIFPAVFVIGTLLSLVF